MKQAQQLQESMQRAQAELADLEVEGNAGGGMVRVSMNGRHEVKSISIEPELLNDERELIEDLVAAAVNDAVRRVEEASREKMSGLTGGMLPPGMKLPF